MLLTIFFGFLMLLAQLSANQMEAAVTSASARLKSLNEEQSERADEPVGEGVTAITLASIINKGGKAVRYVEWIAVFSLFAAGTCFFKWLIT